MLMPTVHLEWQLGSRANEKIKNENARWNDAYKILANAATY